MTKIALAGNPNCGKTTMFNSITGAMQYVGNWPGVTVEKKEGKSKYLKEVIVTDLPGIYSLSPYTSEEIVSRDYLASDEPSAIIDIIDSTNIERSLYLTTQLLELGKPVVLALNMVDSLKKAGDKIDVKKLEEKLGIKIVETVALHNKGIKEIIEAAVESTKTADFLPKAIFSKEIEDAICEIHSLLPDSVSSKLARWTSIKVLERDSVVLAKLQLDESTREKCENITKKIEKAHNDEIEAIITNERYNFITNLLDGVLVKSGKKMTTSDKVDLVVTNRFLGIPIFLAVMWIVYYLSISTIGTGMTDWANDTLFGEWIQGGVETFLTDAGASPVLIDCLVNGVIGGVGAVLGFVPQMAVLFLLLSIVEDVGYMVRIAFVLDKVFRKFGLSGKSFIPLLVGTGCGVPGIMASRTIENENDRRMTIMTTTWIPCGAKLPVIAMMAAIMATKFGEGNGAWVAPLMYAIGIFSVLMASIMLKKTKPFHGPASPFIMELPQYHLPQLKTVLLHTWERLKGYVIKAGTVLFVACIGIWFFSNYGFVDKNNPEVKNSGEFGLCSAIIDEANESNPDLEFASPSDYSLLATIGNGVRYIFLPLGFGNEDGGWQAAAASLSGFAAKEDIVGTMAVLAGAEDADAEALGELDLEEFTSEKSDEEITEESEESEESEEEGDAGKAVDAIARWFPTALAAFCFLLFNLLDSPCFAAIATMASELKNRKWFWFAILFQNIFAWIMTFIVYQVGMFIMHRGTEDYGFGASISGFVIAVVFILFILFMLFRPNPYGKNLTKTEA